MERLGKLLLGNPWQSPAIPAAGGPSIFLLIVGLAIPLAIFENKTRLM
jgi:hypothetical protein